MSKKIMPTGPRIENTSREYNIVTYHMAKLMEKINHFREP